MSRYHEPVVRAWIAIVAAVTAPAAVAAEEAVDLDAARPVHWGVGGGGYLSSTGSDDRQFGASFAAELYPGGRFGRLGVRVEAHGLGQIAPDAFLAGVIFDAAAARPRLQLALIAAVGVDTGGAPLARAGVQSQLWVIGPIALSGDGGGLLRIDGSDTELLLTVGVGLRLAR
jgi:hypothetical protein